MNATSWIDLKIFRDGQLTPWTYQELDQYQRDYCEGLRKNGGPGIFILSEVAPVITLGRRTPASDILLGSDLLRERGVDLYLSDRGGLATYHGPGQWVFFAVGSLEFWTGDRRGVKAMIEGLLAAALGVAKKIDPSSHIRRGPELGVWSAKGKIASVGIHVEKGMVLHGLSLNCFKTPTSFMGIRPCGMDSAVDFLLDQPNDPWFLETGRELVLSASKQFQCHVNLQSLSLTNTKEFMYRKPQVSQFDHVGV